MVNERPNSTYNSLKEIMMNIKNHVSHTTAATTLCEGAPATKGALLIFLTIFVENYYGLVWAKKFLIYLENDYCSAL